MIDKFIPFSTDVSKIPLPNNFDYPHNYTPHLLAKIAAKELQEYLKNQTGFKHNFGIKNTEDKDALGKMFGVLVVKNNNGDLGYLTAFSGKIANVTQLNYFVPPVYNVLSKNGFYLKTEEKLNQINQKIEILKNNPQRLKIKQKYAVLKQRNKTLLKEEALKIKTRRKRRKQQEKKDKQ
mgnify:CR=1 FL=1